MPFDFEGAMKSLQEREKAILEKGKSDGIEENPATGDKDFNAFQLDIKFDCQKIARELINDSKNSVQDYWHQMTTCSSNINESIVMPDIDLDSRSLKQSIHSFLARQEQDYKKKYHNQILRDKELKGFQESLGITQPAEMPPSILAHYQIVAVYGILESILNGVMFIGTDFGALEAFMLSTIIAALNIIPSVFIGNYFRNKNSENLVLKRLAYGVISLWLIFIIWFNTGVSIFRSIGDHQTLNQGEIFFNSAFALFMFKAPPINDMTSILLWIVGIFFAFLACWKGYVSDDKTPEYGKISKRFFEADHEYSESSNQIKEFIQQEINSFDRKFQTIQNEFERNLRDCKSASKILIEKIGEFNRKLSEITNQYEHLISLYWDGSKSTRKSDLPQYATELNVDLEISKDIPDYDAYSSQNLEAMITGLNTTVRTKVDELKKLNILFNDCCAEINKEVESKISQWHLDVHKWFNKPF
jgi:hypothetical protein